MHAKATLSGTPLAETSTYEFVEGNIYFPPSSLKAKGAGVEMTPTQHKTWCSWKGEASYYDVHVDGQVVQNGAWYYPQPLDKATHIRDFVAFNKSKIQVDKE